MFLGIFLPQSKYSQSSFDISINKRDTPRTAKYEFKCFDNFLSFNGGARARVLYLSSRIALECRLNFNFGGSLPLSADELLSS